VTVTVDSDGLQQHSYRKLSKTKRLLHYYITSPCSHVAATPRRRFTQPFSSWSLLSLQLNKHNNTDT